MEIPSDSPSKFVAIGSLILMLYTLNICIANYEKAEIAVIELESKVATYEKAVKRFSENSDVIFNRAALFENAHKSYTQLKLEELLKTLDKAEQRTNVHKEIDNLKIEVEKAVRLSELQSKIKNFWFYMATLCLSIGLVTSSLGFFYWFRSSNTVS